MIQRYFTFLLALLLVGGFATGMYGQAVLTPNGPTGGAYSLVEAAGFGVEGTDASSPDCVSSPATEPGNHIEFGEHIVQDFASDLGPAGTNVFNFISHIDEDSDRCLTNGNGEVDRVRIEIKGGPEGQSDPELEHQFGETSYYRWQFKLDDGFVGTPSFTHLFQNKAEGGVETSLPILTLTARVNVLEIVYNANNVSGQDQKLANAQLTSFRGKWVEVFIKQLHTNAGTLDVVIKDVETGQDILSYSNSNIDLWREISTTNIEFINRPKWGIYRSKRLSGTVPNRMRDPSLRDEIVQFAGFCSSETSEALCPSIIPSDPVGNVPGPVRNTLPVSGAENVPQTMPIVWDAVAEATNYTVNFSASLSQLGIPENTFTVSDTLYYPVALNPGTTYYYRVTAGNDAGDGPRGTTNNFSTLANFDDGNWEVVRGHAKPDLESNRNNGGFYSDESNDVASVSEVVATDETGNYAYRYASGPDSDNTSYKWRYRQSADEEITVVLRIAPVAGVTNMTFVEFRGLGWRQKIRINRNSLKFETTAAGDEFNFPAGYFDGEDYRTIRITFAAGPVNPGFAAAAESMIATVYLDESPTIFASAVSNSTTTSRYVDIGRNSSSEYAATFDFIALDPTGPFAPGGGTGLPADLNATSLPLTWSTPLRVDQLPKTRKLTWGVSNQISSDYFTVESKVAGEDFQPLADLTADGDLAAESSFEYRDERVLTGTVYYRIRQTDFDGRFTFSNTVSVRLAGNASISLYPNPTSGTLNVRGISREVVQYRILDPMGVEVRKGKLAADAPSLELSDLLRGAYLFQVISPEGASHVLRFVRQ